MSAAFESPMSTELSDRYVGRSHAVFIMRPSTRSTCAYLPIFSVQLVKFVDTGKYWSKQITDERHRRIEVISCLPQDVQQDCPVREAGMLET